MILITPPCEAKTRSFSTPNLLTGFSSINPLSAWYSVETKAQLSYYESQNSIFAFNVILTAAWASVNVHDSMCRDPDFKDFVSITTLGFTWFHTECTAKLNSSFPIFPPSVRLEGEQN